MAAVVLLTVAWLIKALFLSSQQVPAHPPAVYEISRQIRYSFTVQNTTNRLVNSGVFFAWAPVKQTSTQICRRIDASRPFHIISDELGNQMLRFELQDLPPFGSQLISITADLSISHRPNMLDAVDLEAWLGAEKYIESDHPDLVQTARTLTAGTPMSTTENIFNWVTRTVQYSGYSKKERGALYAFMRKKGDCTEYMYLFTALCRAGGIPARGIGGYIAPENSILNPAAFHNWAEFYHDDRWFPVDPQNNAFVQDIPSYIAMRILSDSPGHPAMQFNRFRVEGRGLSAKMNR